MHEQSLQKALTKCDIQKDNGKLEFLNCKKCGALYFPKVSTNFWWIPIGRTWLWSTTKNYFTLTSLQCWFWTICSAMSWITITSHGSFQVNPGKPPNVTWTLEMTTCRGCTLWAFGSSSAQKQSISQLNCLIGTSWTRSAQRRLTPRLFAFTWQRASWLRPNSMKLMTSWCLSAMCRNTTGRPSSTKTCLPGLTL